MNKLAIYVNEQTVCEYDEDMHIEDEKLVFLDNMDTDMERGIKI